jgi:hypothetical protein
MSGQLSRIGAIQKDRYDQAAEEAYVGLKQTRAKAEADAEAKRRWEAEQAAAMQRHKDSMGLQWAQEQRQRRADELQASQDKWSPRVDPVTGAPIAWVNGRTGETIDALGNYYSLGNSSPGQQRLPASTASVAASAAGGPAMPTAEPTGRGGGGRGGPAAGLFGLPPTLGSTETAGGPQPSAPRNVGPTQIDTGSEDPRAAEFRLRYTARLPAEQRNRYIEYNQQLSRIPATISQIQDAAQAFGPTSDYAAFIPGQPGTWGGVAQTVVRNLQDKTRSPEELRARSAVYNQAYEVIHALAGAALSTGEKQRLEAFLPAPTDPIEKILANLEQAYATAQHGIQGYEGQLGIPEQYRTRFQDVTRRPTGASAGQAAMDEIIDLPSR